MLIEIVFVILGAQFYGSIANQQKPYQQSEADVLRRQLLLEHSFSEDNFKHQQHNKECSAPYINEDAMRGHQGGTLMLQNVCLEQDTIVVHDSSILDTLDAGYGKGLPSFDITRFQEYFKHSTHNPHPLRPIEGSVCHYDPLRFRFPSALEVKRAKHFSKCTLPVLVFAHWIHSYGEYFTRAAWMYNLQIDQKMIDKNVTLVWASCANIPLSPYHLQLSQPYSNHQVTSWATFAGRAALHSHSNSTAEGIHTRCFEKLLIMGLDQTKWSQTYLSAQYTLEYYKSRGMVPDYKLFDSDKPEVLRMLFEFRPADSQVHHDPRRIPKHEGIDPSDPILRQTINRSHLEEPPEYKGRKVYPGARQILNLQEILDRCNDPTASNWTERLKGTRWTSVECRAYSFGRDLFEGMAVAQQADVFISLHGSGEMNSMFMRRNTIKIQMRQKDFGTVHRYLSNGYWPLVCHQNNFPFQCWFINFDEDKSFEPGISERLGIKTDFPHRDRHLWLNFDHMAIALRETLLVHDHISEYLQRWENRSVALTFNQNGTMTYFTHISKRMSKKLRRQQ